MPDLRSPFAHCLRLSVAVIVTAGLLGCGGGSETAPAEISLRRLAKYYGTFTTIHKGVAPANEKEFQAFIKSKDAEADFDKLFRSDRDGQPYVVFYLGAAKISPDRVIAHEKDGAGGKRFVAFSTTAVRELDEAEFKQAIDKRP